MWARPTVMRRPVVGALSQCPTSHPCRLQLRFLPAGRPYRILAGVRCQKYIIAPQSAGADQQWHLNSCHFCAMARSSWCPISGPVTQCLPVLEAPDSVLAPSWLSHQDLTVFQFLGLPCLHYQQVTCLTPKPLVRVDSPPHHTIGKHPATELSPPLRIALTQHNRALTPSSDPPVLRL